MFKTLRGLLALGLSSVLGSTSVGAQPEAGPDPVLLFEVQAALTADAPPHTFQVYGDREAGSFTAYGVHIVAPDGSTQLLDGFESVLPANSEADALVVEDLNFDGQADLRLMEYLPGGSSIPFHYWLYDPETGAFASAEAYRVVKSPEVDPGRGWLISRQTWNPQERVTEFYDPDGWNLTIRRREVRQSQTDGTWSLQATNFETDSEGRPVESPPQTPNP